MGRMVEPELRLVSKGKMEGTELSSGMGPILTIVSNLPVFVLLRTGLTQKADHSEYTYSICSDTGGKDVQDNYPR
jgi:hypothetical protein